MSAENKLVKGVGYMRVSTDVQGERGVSLTVQKERIERWAQMEGYELDDVPIYFDVYTGTKRERPGLVKAVKAACEHRVPLVVYSLSRLARSTRDCLDLCEELQTWGAELVSLTEHIDTTTAMGRTFFRLCAVFAEMERDLISERTKAALASKKASGERVSGRPPFGFKHKPYKDRHGQTKYRVVEDEKEQDVIETIMDLREEGENITGIVDYLTGDDPKHPVYQPRAEKWHWRTIRDIIAREEQRMLKEE